jgi:hypothetical protein
LMEHTLMSHGTCKKHEEPRAIGWPPPAIRCTIPLDATVCLVLCAKRNRCTEPCI